MKQFFSYFLSDNGNPSNLRRKSNKVLFVLEDHLIDPKLRDFINLIACQELFVVKGEIRLTKRTNITLKK